MMISKFDPHHGYLSSVSLRLQMVCPNTWILWLLWLSWLLWILWFIISFRMAHKEKWTKFFADLLVLGLAYIIFIFTVNSFTFIFISSQPSERTLPQFFHYAWITFTLPISSAFNYVITRPYLSLHYYNYIIVNR